jgi:hypothetical protein
MKGEYEWSSIGKQLREKSMVLSPWVAVHRYSYGKIATGDLA